MEGSAILHCFNWSYNSIREALPDIAAAGYTAVQTSPVQQPKDYNASWKDLSGQWWKMYQPLGLRVSDGNTWLGTKAQLTSLCAEAEKYNIKVIADIVVNHLANNGSDGGGYSNLNSGVDTDMKNSSYYHSDTYGINDDNRYNITHYHLGMPDLNTADSFVQQKALALLKECVDCGVDGFRFDAAKHIELPTDPSNTRSDFWPNVLNGVKSYTDNDLYFYGEILGSAGTDISNYTTYMNITDNYTGDRALDKAYYQAAEELADCTYFKGAGAADSVLWVESHDTYMGNSGMAGFSNTSGISDEHIIRAWAIVASRGDSSSLFFARPNSVMGQASTDTTWKSPAVAEVNKFKNAFDGKSEYLASYGKVAYNERGTKGVVISKLDGGGNVSLPAHTIADGTYTDHITGNTFTVRGGTISGTVGDTGVAVVYNTGDTNDPVISAGSLYLVPNNIWTGLNLRYAIYLFNTNGEYQWINMTKKDSDTYVAEVPEEKWNQVIFVGLRSTTPENNWTNKVYQTDDLFPDSGTNCYTVAPDTRNNGGGTWGQYTSPQPTEPTTQSPTTEPTTAPVTEEPTTVSTDETYTVYVANTLGWSNMNIHYWGNSSTQWPGKAMEPYSGNGVFTAQIPMNTKGIVFNNGSGKQTVDITSGIEDNAVWIISSETSGSKYKADTAPTYYLIGSMNGWTDQEDYIFRIGSNSDGKLEYKLENIALTKNDEIKVNDNRGGWYPPVNNNCVVSATGIYNIYFRPQGDGNSDWHQNYFYLQNITPHTVTWLDGDGNTLKTDIVTHGETPNYTGDIPTKSATAQYTYTFSGWSPAISAITGDITYTAQFTPTLRSYTITWLDGNGEVLQEQKVTYGTTPVYNGTEPTKTSVDQYTYVFSGEWSPEITPVTGNTTYMAQFNSTEHTYSVTWKNFDGTVLKTDDNQELGTTPVYSGATPQKPADAKYTYAFMGWSPAVLPLRGNTVYTAQFASIINKYTVTWENEDGSVLAVDSNIAYGNTVSERIPPDKMGYTFIGWYRDAAKYAFSTPITSDITLKAKWEFTAENGDVNLDGIINIADVTAIQRYLCELEELSGEQLSVADVNGDCIVDIADATYLQITLVE